MPGPIAAYGAAFNLYFKPFDTRLTAFEANFKGFEFVLKPAQEPAASRLLARNVKRRDSSVPA